jgi:hydroxylaminobenzene mutase
MTIQGGGRQLLMHGMVLILVGLVWGLVVPGTPYPRLALGLANAWWGTLQPLSIAAGQAGATGGESWQELVLKVTHIGAGLGLIIAWALLVIGFLKDDSSKGVTDAPTV